MFLFLFFITLFITGCNHLRVGYSALVSVSRSVFVLGAVRVNLEPGRRRPWRRGLVTALLCLPSVFAHCVPSVSVVTSLNILFIRRYFAIKILSVCINGLCWSWAGLEPSLWILWAFKRTPLSTSILMHSELRTKALKSSCSSCS